MKLLSPALRRAALRYAQHPLSVSECRATQQYVVHRADDDTSLRSRIVTLAWEYGRYGYRRITALLHQEGWRVNHQRVERIWRQEGLKVLQKQPTRTRLWLADGSCIRQRPAYPNHVWSYDFVMDRTQDGRSLKLLTVITDRPYELSSTREKILSWLVPVPAVNNPALPGGAFANQEGSFLRFATGCHSSPLFRAGHPGRSS